MLRLIGVGCVRAGPEQELFTRYTARLRPPLTVAEVAEARGTPAEAKRREGAALLAALPARAFAVALDHSGQVADLFDTICPKWTFVSDLCLQKLADNLQLRL